MVTPTRCRIWFTFTARLPNYGPFRPWCECGWRPIEWYPQPAGAQAAADQHLVNARYLVPVRKQLAR